MNISPATKRGSLGRIACALLLLFCITPTLLAQKKISGVVNRYTWVDEIDYCTNTLVLSDPFWARPGGRALLVQMQGAVVDSSYASQFGNIVRYNSAGNYEVVTIRQVTGESVEIASPLLNRYDPAGRLQLVDMPVYRDAVVEGSLEAMAWDGSVGGVIALEVAGTLTLQGDIDASGKGFRGGRHSLYRNGGADSFRVHPYQSGIGGEKGEGIAFPIRTMEAGRGALANGGGGGNEVNAGGGGGGNGGPGGKGGGEGGWGYDIPVGGLGGQILRNAIDSGSIFLGGGGGGGQQNDRSGTSGGRGGGIVLIIASKIVGNGFRIAADGDSALPAGIDGSGGGGAGGTLVIETEAFSGRLGLSVKGGRGGNNHSDGTEWNGHPPGGGGGGGIVMTTRASIGSSVRLELAGGKEGRIINDNSSRYGEAYNAKPGGSGTYLPGRLLNRSVIPFVPVTIDAGPDITVCAGWPGERIGKGGSGGIPPYSYRWLPSSGLDSDTAAFPVASPAATTTYYCEMVDARGCRSLDSVTVNVIFSAIRLVTPLENGAFEIDTTIVRAWRCDEVVLENVSDAPVTIPAIALGRNIEFSIPPSQIPFVILPGEQRALRFCYKPTALRYDHDTLAFSLSCWHRIPLKGRGAIGLLSGSDSCGNDIDVRVLGDTLRRVQVGIAHPNPTSDFISIPILRRFLPEDNPTAGRCLLHDHLGNVVAIGSYRSRKRIDHEDSIDESGTYEIDCSALPSGLYYVVIDSPGAPISRPIIITR